MSKGRQAAIERMRHMLDAAEAIGHYAERDVPEIRVRLTKALERLG